jgi:predicted DCC family thiol-disulfide oxidoreductase YuxK
MGWVLFIDGECAFCGNAARRLARWDKRGVVRIAPLQGEFAKTVDIPAGAAGADGSVVLLRQADGRLFTSSDAWIELARALGGRWRICTVLRWIPKGWRDAAYRWVARHRHQLARHSGACPWSDPALRGRWLE